jgi:hypothetical protein
MEARYSQPAIHRLIHPIMGRIHRGKVDMPPIHKGQFGGEEWKRHALRDMPRERLDGDVIARLDGTSHKASHSLLQDGKISSRIGNVIRNHVLLRRVRLRVGHGLGKIQGIGGRTREGPPGVFGQLLLVFPPEGTTTSRQTGKQIIPPFYKLT